MDPGIPRPTLLKNPKPPLRPMKLGMMMRNPDNLCPPKSFKPLNGTGKRPKITCPLRELNRRSVYSKLKMQPLEVFVDNLMLLAPAWPTRQ
jgi:hypothetical protein